MLPVSVLLPDFEGGIQSFGVDGQTGFNYIVNYCCNFLLVSNR
jgi:hypothetical protein